MLNPKDKNKVTQLFTNIHRRVYETNLPCMCSNCGNLSINSHLLQKNGILSLITQNGHMYEPKIGNMFDSDFRKSPVQFKLVGTDQALSVHTFCKYHDEMLFSDMEKKGADISSCRSYLLLTYRTLCAEARRKEYEIEVTRRFTDSNIVNSLFSQYEIQYYKEKQIKGNKLGFADLLYHSNEIEKELNEPTGRYVFLNKSFPITGIYASSVVSIADIKDNQKEPFCLYTFHIIPTNSGSIVILGYDKHKVKPWVKEYFEELLDKNDSNIEEYITSFLIRTEGWGMSPIVYKQLKKNKIQEYFRLFQIDRADLVSQRFDGFNLFDGVLKNEYVNHKVNI